MRGFGLDPSSPLLKKENIYLFLFGIVSWLRSASILPDDTNVEATALTAVQVLLAVVAGVNYLISVFTKGKTPLVVLPFFVACLLLVTASGPAAAAPAQGSAERIDAGLVLGGSIYSPPEGGSAPHFNPAALVTYSGTENFTLSASGDWNFGGGGDGWGAARAGLISSAVGTKAGDKFVVGIGAEWAYYYGDVPAWVVHRSSWGVPIRAAWPILHDGGGRPRAFIQLGAAYDARNKTTRSRIALNVPFYIGTPAAAAPVEE